VKMLLTLMLVLSSACYGSGPLGAGKDRPKIQLEHPVNPHVDIPRNCKTTIQPDDSVVLTCECEHCGQLDDREQPDPVPWVCKPGDGGLYCSYDIDPQRSVESGRHART
jgi:hypothetical protein